MKKGKYNQLVKIYNAKTIIFAVIILTLVLCIQFVYPYSAYSQKATNTVSLPISFFHKNWESNIDLETYKREVESYLNEKLLQFNGVAKAKVILSVYNTQLVPQNNDNSKYVASTIKPIKIESLSEPESPLLPIQTDHSKKSYVSASVVIYKNSSFSDKTYNEISEFICNNVADLDKDSLVIIVTD